MIQDKEGKDEEEEEEEDPFGEFAEELEDVGAVGNVLPANFSSVADDNGNGAGTSLREDVLELEEAIERLDESAEVINHSASENGNGNGAASASENGNGNGAGATDEVQEEVRQFQNVANNMSRLITDTLEQDSNASENGDANGAASQEEEDPALHEASGEKAEGDGTAQAV